MESDLIGTAAAASLLGRSHSYVHRLVDSGELEVAFKAPGGNSGIYMFKREHVTAIKEKREAAETAKAAAAS